MQFTQSFADVREKVHTDDSGKWDLVLRRDQLSMQGGRLVLPEAHRGEHPDAVTPSPWALSQLCQRLSIPVSYFRRCPPALQDAQFTYWAQQAEGESRSDGERWMLRAKGSALRGVLSERYARLDNAALLETLQPLLAGTRFQVGWFALSSESLHLRLLDPGLAREVLPGDRLLVGIHLANSEVGKRAVTVDALVFRLVCTNGLIRQVAGKSLLYQRHIGLPGPRFATALSEAIAAALTVAAGFIEQLIWATRQPVKDVEGTLTAIAAQHSLSQGTQELMKFSLLAEPIGQQETLYGLVNALTSAAQRLSIDERYDLEALAGRLLTSGLPQPSPNGHGALPVPTGRETPLLALA